jgi:hypothetical protein
MTIHEMVNYISIRLKQDMEKSPIFPYDKTTPEDKRKYPRHMRDVALAQNVTYLISPDLHYFEIGNESAEENTPHYHILEDAKNIYYPYRGTKKSKGSQALIGRKSQRDYGLVSYRQTQKGTKTGLIQEYRQNMTRNYAGRLFGGEQPREYYKRKLVSNVNKRNYRYNKHYQYIERMLFEITPNIANYIGAKLKIGSSDLLDGNQLAGYLTDNYEMEKTNYDTFLKSWRKS